MIATLALAVLVSGPVARADVIGAPPGDCAVGARGESSHEGAFCLATSCTDDSSCRRWSSAGDERAYACRPAGLCVDRRTLPLVGRLPEEMRGATVTLEIAERACSSDAECTAPQRCEIAPRCVALTLPEAVAQRVGCTCAAAGACPPGRGPLFAALVAVLGRRLRRRRLRAVGSSEGLPSATPRSE